jgi:hypothetical protein
MLNKRPFKYFEKDIDNQPGKKSIQLLTFFQQKERVNEIKKKNDICSKKDFVRKRFFFGQKLSGQASLSLLH